MGIGTNASPRRAAIAGVQWVTFYLTSLFAFDWFRQSPHVVHRLLLPLGISIPGGEPVYVVPTRVLLPAVAFVAGYAWVRTGRGDTGATADRRRLRSVAVLLAAQLIIAVPNGAIWLLLGKQRGGFPEFLVYRLLPAAVPLLGWWVAYCGPDRDGPQHVSRLGAVTGAIVGLALAHTWAAFVGEWSTKTAAILVVTLPVSGGVLGRKADEVVNEEQIRTFLTVVLAAELVDLLWQNYWAVLASFDHYVGASNPYTPRVNLLSGAGLLPAVVAVAAVFAACKGWRRLRAT